MVILFSITKVMEYNSKIRPVYFSSTQDIEVLDRFKKQIESDDFILNWWNYSWPLWYYINQNITLIDNGKHQQDNFIISRIFLSDNQTFIRNSSLFFPKIYREGVQHGFPKAMDYFLTKYSMEQFKKLENREFNPPKLNGDVYILLHSEMVYLLPILELFSNFDPKSGKYYESGVIDGGYLTELYEKSQTVLGMELGSIDLKSGVIKIKDIKNRMKQIYIVEDKKLKFKKIYYSPNRDINVIIYNGRVLILNRKLFNSFLVQVLVFNKYNRDYFDEVAKGEDFIILKVKK
jgi:dolichyl-diphosphooligosaccharide--protein glycosyltransferase/undecaprenyl-diphosphooligosaccharide--protein glycosyltransferase